MIEIRRLIIIGYSELALKLYRIYSKSFKVEIIYSERELKEFGKKIKVLKNYKIYLVKNIDKYLMKFERKNIFIFSLGSTFIFKKKIIDKFKNRIFNCHNTDLPKWKGGGDISYRIMNSYNFGATSVHEVSNKIDEGRIVFQKKYKINPINKNPLQLKKEIEKKAIGHLKIFFDNLILRKKFTFKKNKIDQGFYLPRLDTNIHGAIDWNWDGRDINSFVNSFSKPYKGAFSFCRNKKITIYKLNLKKEKFLKHPFMYGLVFKIHLSKFYVVAKNYSLIIDKKNFKSPIDLKVGDRLYTPASFFDKYKRLRVFYSPEGKIFKR